MPKFDLSNAADFSRVTQQTAGGVGTLASSLIPGLDPSQWTVQESSFRGVKFHVFKLSSSIGALANGIASAFSDSGNFRTNWQGSVSRITDTDARRKVKIKYPYRDGQTTDDLGREGATFQFDAMLFGDRYKEGFDALRAAFADPTPATLIHAVRGPVRCVFERAEYVYEHTTRKAVTMNLTFIEHNFDISTLDALSTNLFKTLLSRVITGFGVLDGVINRVQAAQLLSREAKQRISLLVAAWKRAIGKNTAQMNRAFNTPESSGDVPGVVPVQDGGTATAGNGLQLTGDDATDLALIQQITSTNDFVTLISISDPFNNIPVAELAQTTVAALAVPTLVKNVQGLRDAGQIIINEIRGEPIVAQGAPGTAGAPGYPEIELFDVIESIKETAIAVQNLLESGVASQRARIIPFIVPRIMSLREAAFLHGIVPDRVQELIILNAELLSVNHLEPGTVLQVPVT